MNKSKHPENEITEILLALSLSIMICLLLTFEYVFLRKDNSLLIYLLLCSGQIGLGIMINRGLLEEKENE